MKKMKSFAATIMIAVSATAGYFEYTVYERMTMTDTEHMLMVNIEALTSGEVDRVTCESDLGCLVGSTPVPDYDEVDSLWR